MRQQFMKMDPVEKGFRGPDEPEEEGFRLEEKDPFMSSFVVWFELMRYV